MSKYKWGSPSLMSCSLESWSGKSYSLRAICPTCGGKTTTGISSGLRPAYNSNDIERVKSQAHCNTCKKFFEYGFTITAI